MIRSIAKYAALPRFLHYSVKKGPATRRLPLPLLPSGPGGVHGPTLAGPHRGAPWAGAPIGGEEGIRTPGTFRYTRFPVVHLRPLGHLSWRSPPSCSLQPLLFGQGPLRSSTCRSKNVAESKGFEPLVPLGTRDFESRTFDHSDSSPRRKLAKRIGVSTAVPWLVLGANCSEKLTQQHAARIA